MLWMSSKKELTNEKVFCIMVVKCNCCNLMLIEYARTVFENHILLRLMENPQMRGFRNPEE
jgi:hypothetical protein